MTGQLSRKKRLPVLLVIGYFVFLLQAAAWADSPVQNSGKTTSAIDLNAEEQQTVQAHEILVRERPTNGQPGKTFEAVAIMEAGREVIRDIVMDYPSYPDFMPNVSRIEILAQDENTALLNQTLSLPLGKIKKYRIKLEASEPDEQTSLIQWQLQPWPELKLEETIRDTTGFWRIEELDAARSLVLYHVSTDPGKVPFGLGWIVDILSKDSVPDVVTKTRERAERVSALLKAQEQ
ncbi:Ribosome association toxin PasT (RatA) of the RatAB toxin-antitoxin module [Candidatus Electrothrix marina]|uniref:Ribosome association toxin PasT (RatA) of the RatAB toxin-antitoxin module n=1 Tax=Candidatus Electrothrix marina TaxID=1859130 RepID=A0A444JFF6_9BACT|nr:Ribosome association toxin PasT (RatA) of the RatAB toxin-antitoxin module [Candidatus Electrothrix marina]